MVVNKEEFLKNIKRFQGILNLGEGQALLKKLRDKEYERDRNLEKRLSFS